MFIASRLHEMDEPTCVELLQDTQHRVGRLAWDDGEVVTILPVNFVLDVDTIIVRTGEGAVWEAALEGRRVAFEVDSLSSERPAREHEWSVLARGVARPVLEADELTYLRLARLEPAAGGLKTRFVAIDVHTLTGRRT